VAGTGIPGSITVNSYSCQSSVAAFPLGTVSVTNFGLTGSVITNFCTTDNCNTGSAKDSATLTCYLGEKAAPFYGLIKISCSGSCVVSFFSIFCHQVS